MHGLEWRMPLLIELDELHRSRVIDPDLSDEKVSMPQETAYRNRQGGRVKRGSRGRDYNSRMRPSCHSDPHSSEQRKPNSQDKQASK